MKKMSKILISGTIVLFFGACGGSSSGETGQVPADPMMQKDVVVIMYHYPKEICESDTMRSELEVNVPKAKNLLIRSESNDVTCASYGKREEETAAGGCVTKDMSLEDSQFADYDTSCVIGFDIDPGNGMQPSVVKKDIVMQAGFVLDSVE